MLISTDAATNFNSIAIKFGRICFVQISMLIARLEGWKETDIANVPYRPKKNITRNTLLYSVSTGVYFPGKIMLLSDGLVKLYITSSITVEKTVIIQEDFCFLVGT